MAGGPQAESGDTALCGVYYAIVTQNKDDELGQARVKVRFPWMPGGERDQSSWAQLAVPMAGSGYGTYVLPEVNDSVLVVFLAGDIRHPVVIGGTWNRSDAPPESNDSGSNDVRFIKSRSGHRLSFEDSTHGKAVLTDRTERNYVGVGEFASGGDSANAKTLSVPKGINGAPVRGVSVTAATGAVRIWCPNGALTVKAQHAELTALEAIDVKAAGELEVEGTATGKVCAASAGKLEGGTLKVGP